ncbi:UNC93-like protein [Araneus ventricosus]|uniref:UNC93-like protein n=1 Tax=Araneus ventricosus TaxID=182803 RepID=A0A4Y2A9P8_ARAVE|nr:UNC93-like protein [Araneus ventricosus]
MKSRDLLVEFSSLKQSEQLLSIIKFGEIPVTVSAHASFNYTWEVMSSDEFLMVSDAEFVSELEAQKDIKSIINKYQPICLGLEETYLKPHLSPKFKNYTTQRRDFQQGSRASGGVAYLTSCQIPSKPILLKTQLQAVALQIQLNSRIIVCYLYLPPSVHIEQKRLDGLIQQLPSPFLLLGDFNGHNPLSGSSDTNPRGRQIETLIDDHESGKIVLPLSWLKAIVIPIPKPGKDKQDPNNYRPISLTSYLNKLLERMVGARLMHVLETSKWFTPSQSGYRKRRGTIDNLLKLETAIRKAFVRKKNFVSIFFDMEKAYDRTWRYGILKDIFDTGLKGNLPLFIKNFPQTRVFQIRIDDIQIHCAGEDMSFIQRQLQTAVNNMNDWASKNGFLFSPQKTVCMQFCRRRGLYPDPEFQLNGSTIPSVQETKFLGIIFDTKLTFRSHVKHLKIKCIQTLNIMKVLTNTSWGANKVSLMRIYRSLVHSKLDYGAPVYGSAAKPTLKILDSVHHQGLRLATGAFRTTPIPSLHVISGDLRTCLELRRHRLSLSTFYKIKGDEFHPQHYKSFIGCAWGSSYVGIVTVFYGAACAFAATLSGYLVKYIGRIPIFLTAQLVNIGIGIFMMLWVPDPNRPIMFFVTAGLCGIVTGIFWAQIPAFYGVLFKKDEEAAFGCYYVCNSLGWLIPFLISDYICTSIKIYMLLTVSTLGILGYLITERLYFKRKNQISLRFS